MQSKLLTPLGLIKVYDNGIEIEYNLIKLDIDSRIFPKIDGRYKITINFQNDNMPHLISCLIDGIDVDTVKHYSESGERLESQAFYQGNTKLSIGIEVDDEYLFSKWGKISKYSYDYINLDNGIGFDIFSTTKSQTFIFGIAWINECNDDIEVQTWLAADPTIM